jgi:Fic family protein/predicted transcriptional regulator
MLHFNDNERRILAILIRKENIQSSEIHENFVSMGKNVSLVTIKRALTALTERKAIRVKGAGRSVVYEITTMGRVFIDLDATVFCSEEPDVRMGSSQYNFNLLNEMPEEIFSEEEIAVLEKATEIYRKHTQSVPETVQVKELERFLIELSWKSSKIEGNTYTLLDTEKLILENKEAKGKTSDETRMILNHKEAFMFIYEHLAYFKELSRKNLEELHSLLIKDMRVQSGIREVHVGITGSKYVPLDNKFQIQEAVESLIKAVSRMKDPQSKSLLTLIGISYIQPFEDGNKRTSRLMANALLMAHGLAPLSYRSVNEKEYREAMLAIYEINTIVPFKKIFLEQYSFASNNYAMKF